MKNSLKVFSGSANPQLAQAICQHMGVPMGQVELGRFPDGETFAQIKENIRGQDVFIVQSTSNPANEHWMELFILIDAARRASAKRITAVVPFYGYARQDRKDRPRVPITSKLVANLLCKSGADRVIALDLHAPQLQGFFDIPFDHLNASPILFEHLEKYVNEDPKKTIAISPDVGGMKLTAMYADLLNCELGFVAKRRIDAETVQATNLVGDVKGRTVLLIDDMTETLGTLNAAAKMCKEQGAAKAIGVVSHAMLTELSYQRMQEGFIDELVCTNSVPVDTKGFPITVLDVAPLLGEAMARIHQNTSVTSLFRINGY